MVRFKNPLTKQIFVKIAQWCLSVLHCLGGDAYCLLASCLFLVGLVKDYFKPGLPKRCLTRTNQSRGLD